MGEATDSHLTQWERDKKNSHFNSGWKAKALEKLPREPEYTTKLRPSQPHWHHLEQATFLQLLQCRSHLYKFRRVLQYASSEVALLFQNLKVKCPNHCLTSAVIGNMDTLLLNILTLLYTIFHQLFMLHLSLLHCWNFSHTNQQSARYTFTYWISCN